jgi:two-component system copper resistance phosphate regulon response regulator CusR
MKVLIIEDEQKVAAFIKKGLEELSNQADIISDGLTIKEVLANKHYDVIVLDINLPYLNGFEVCKHIRLVNADIPIIMLTALNATDDKIKGFDAGADDYLAKPFEFKELIARLKSLTRRNNLSTKNENVLKAFNLEMNLDNKTVKRDGVKIELTAKEFGLLEYLMKNKNKVISRSEIAEKVWDISFDTGTNVIDVYVNFLRKKIDKEFNPKLIHSRIGMGYILSDEN